MRLADSFIGKDGKTLAPYINNSKIIEIVEISSNSELQKKLEELKRSLLKKTDKFVIIALKQ